MKYFITIFALMFGCALQAQWYQVNSNTSENLHDIFFVDSLTGYCVGGGDMWGAPQGNGVVLETTDGGENWDVIFSQDSLSIQHVAVVNENNYTKLYGFALKNGTSYLLTTFLSSQFQNWTLETSSYNASDVQVLDNVIYFIETSDQSLNKLQNNQTNMILPDVSIFAINSSEIVYLKDAVDSVHVFSMSDNINISSNILPQEMGQNQITNARIAFYNDTIVIKGTYPNLVTRSFNEGIDWQTYTNDGPGFESVIISTSNLYGMDNLYRIQVTLDAGETWQIQDSLGVRINRLYFYNDTTGFAVGEEGDIFKTTNGGGVITSTNGIEDLKKKIKVFPNPSSGQLEIEIDNHLNVYGLSVVNQTGRSVAKYFAGQNKIDLSRFPDGIYFIKFLTDKGPHTEKVVIRK